MNQLTTRRDLLIAGGLGILASAGVVSTAAAKNVPPLTEREKANIKLVQEFIQAWNQKPVDIDKIVQKYFAPNATVRWTDDQPPAIGTAAAIAAAKAGMPPGSWAEIRLDNLFAKGQLVATARLDVIKIPGQPDQVFDTAGLHIIKDGKFIEYTDYVVK